MREIKYQAWLHDEKQMVNVIEINTFDKYIRYYDISHCQDDAEIFDFIRSNLPNADCGFEECDLRQYTGLKDKNGKEIYEGDIVRISNHPFDGPIEVNRNYAVSYNSEMELCCGSWLLFRMRHYAEVIGNVFEHRELLEVNAS
ncbi:YopX family protein [Aneurinibacillus migulanus]|uniref:YopX family protein n=1 Tax=Aneurinibacillus migulanus TaxID=47500 RepID=UPI0020A1716B|nr:YopX family protein [Aneurinibacillus migulanus]MCP1355049.1 YopX family protein [Aneurinibacillus migulanus]